MKILMVTSEFPPTVGGVASHVDGLARHLAQRGHELAVLVHRRGDEPPHETRRSVTVSRIDLPALRWLYEIKLRCYLWQRLASQAVDLIHVHGMKPLLAVRDLGVPICFTNHTSGFLKRAAGSTRRQRAALRRLAHCAAVVAPSEELIDATKQVGYTGPTHYIPNGVDVDTFSPGGSDLRTTLDIPDNAFVIVLARRLVDKNGVLYFAKAAATMTREDCYFIIAGDGAHRQDFENILRDSAAWSRVRMLGTVPNQQMPDVYRAADVAVLPSLMEATSIAGLEAMSCALPLIGTRVGGIPAIIDHDVTGYLVEPRQPQQIAQHMQALADNRNIARALGEQARAKVLAEFAWPVVAQKTEHVFQTLLHHD